MSVDAVYGFIMTIIGINGVPEAIVAAILTMVIGRILLKLKERLTLKNIRRIVFMILAIDIGNTNLNDRMF